MHIFEILNNEESKGQYRRMVLPEYFSKIESGGQRGVCKGWQEAVGG